MDDSQNIVGKFLDPDAIMAQLDVKRGDIVADFGCGPGYFSVPFAKIVGEGGRVHSLDILPQSLETVMGKAKNSGVANILTKRVNLEKENGSKLDSNSVDWVVLKDVLFQNQNKSIIIGEAYRVLKTGGKAIVIEWSKKDSAVGPEQALRIPAVDLEKMFSDQKFIVEKNVEAGDFHYAFVAVKTT